PRVGGVTHSSEGRLGSSRRRHAGQSCAARQAHQQRDEKERSPAVAQIRSQAIDNCRHGAVTPLHTETARKPPNPLAPLDSHPSTAPTTRISSTTATDRPGCYLVGRSGTRPTPLVSPPACCLLVSCSRVPSTCERCSCGRCACE